MPVERFTEGTDAQAIRALTPDPPTGAVAEIVAAVRDRGDAAVVEFEQRFGGSSESVRALGREELQSALATLDSDLRAALELAIANVSAVAERQLTGETDVQLPQGQTVALRSVPVASAAAYVPGGRGSYPSTAIMCLVPARVAGVGRICVTSPPREDGKIDSTVLAVCALLEVDEVYEIGGAQAIAALALGTDAIAPVDVIIGPGNAFVQEAKRQLFGSVGIDAVAGPSELAIVADDSANPQHVALDLLAQAEHGPDSLVVLASPDGDLLDAVEVLLGGVEASVALVKCATVEAALELADELAPEHLQLCCETDLATRLAQQVRRAGCLFVGHNAATAFGDYVAGSNHVLPTGSAARYASALSAATFVRRMAQVTIPGDALGPLAQAGAAIADAEGFPAHARSMSERAQNDADES